MYIHTHIYMRVYSISTFLATQWYVHIYLHACRHIRQKQKNYKRRTVTLTTLYCSSVVPVCLVFYHDFVCAICVMLSL